MNMVTVAEWKKLQKKKSKSKYHAIKTKVDEIEFDSRKEAEYYKLLVIRKRVGDIVSIKLQPRFPYVIHYIHPTTGAFFEVKGCYVSDFEIEKKDGTVEVIDAKGVELPKFKRDRKIVAAIYGIKIKTV